MEKRAILAIVLSLLVVVVWSIFLAPPSPPGDVSPVEREARRAPSTARPLPPSPLTSVPLTVHTSSAVQVMVDTGVAQLTLTGLGAGVESVRLLDYHTTLAQDAAPFVIAPPPEAATVPLETRLQLGACTERLGQLVFVPVSPLTKVRLSPARPDATIVFRSELGAGVCSTDEVVVQRTYRFRYNSYVFEVSTAVEGLHPPAGSTMTLLWGPGLLPEEADGVERRGQIKPTPRSYAGGKVHEAPKESEASVSQGQVDWVALGDTYFTVVLLPQDPPADAAVMRRVEMRRRGEEARQVFEVGVRTPLNQDLKPQTVQIYVGPKSQPLLTEVEPSLGKHLIDLGFFSVLARPMLQLLILVNNVVRNYGITIILVTIVIKIIFFPLTHKSYKSMQGMQKLQPKMKELQARYKDDRQGLNQAMMQLYRGEKVNPMGGCLPMLLQIPVFFAFYNALLYSIELRHAPFICWETSLFWVGRGICDLSVYDPTYITPVLMGASMFLQQRMTPTTADPMQAKMMQFMPLMFMMFFLKAPAGLVVYWLVNNILSIAQQVITNRLKRQETAGAKVVSKE